MNIKLKIWRQKNQDSKGHFEEYAMSGIEEHMSFLEVLDLLNEQLFAARGEDMPLEIDGPERLRAMAEAIRPQLPTGIDLQDLGEHRLKDLLHAERIYQIVAPGLPAEFPPIKTLDRQRHNLPEQPTALVGRAVLLHKGKVIGDLNVEEIRESGRTLVELIKENYRYRAERVGQAIAKMEEEA